MTTSPKRTRESYAFFLDYRTRWSDNDQYGHINNSIYYHLFDSIVNTYLIQKCALDPSSVDIKDASIGLVVASWCQFFSPLSFPQVLHLGLRVNKIGKSSVEYEVGVFEATTTESATQKPSAVGGYTHVFVDKHTRRPRATGMPNATKIGLTALEFGSSTPKL